MRILISVCLILTLLVSLVNLGFNIKDSHFDNIDVLPTGQFLYSSMSPGGDTTVSVYKVAVPTGNAIRGAVVSIDEKGNKSERNIFWEVGTENAMAGWVNNDTISINNHLVNVTDGSVYDSRYDFTKYELD